jgi:hypothetical protein
MTYRRAVRAAFLRNLGWSENEVELYAPAGKWMPPRDDPAYQDPAVKRIWDEFVAGRRG